MLRRMITSSALTVFAVLAGSASAQQVQSAKPATGPADALSSHSLQLQYRNYMTGKNKEERSQFERQEVTSQVRAYFIFGFLDDMVETSAILGAVTETGTQKVSNRPLQILTEVSAVDTDYFAVTPYLDLENVGEDNANGDLGVRPALKYPTIDTPVGGLELSFEVDGEAQFSTDEKEAEIDDDSFALVGREPTEEDKRKSDPSYEVIARPAVTLGLGKLVNGLSAESYVEYTNTFDPKYSLNTDGSRDLSYEPTRSTATSVAAIYEINDALAVSNEFVLYHSGLYEARGDAERTRFINLAKLAYTVY